MYKSSREKWQHGENIIRTVQMCESGGKRGRVFSWLLLQFKCVNVEGRGGNKWTLSRCVLDRSSSVPGTQLRMRSSSMSMWVCWLSNQNIGVCVIFHNPSSIVVVQVPKSFICSSFIHCDELEPEPTVYEWVQGRCVYDGCLWEASLG